MLVIAVLKSLDYECGHFMVLAEYPALYDGCLEWTCPECNCRIGRFTDKVLEEGEHEDPKARYDVY